MVQLLALNGPRFIRVVAVKRILPLLYVVPQGLEFIEVYCSAHVLVKHAWGVERLENGKLKMHGQRGETRDIMSGCKLDKEIGYEVTVLSNQCSNQGKPPSLFSSEQ